MSDSWIVAESDAETVQLPANVIDRDIYIRDALQVGDASVTIYLHESLTPDQVLNLLVEQYKAWAVNRPGARR